MSDHASDPLALFQRLPALYRQRDAETGGQLRVFLDVLEHEARIFHDSVLTYWNDLFVDTADPSMLPRHADLLGVNAKTSDPRRLRIDLARANWYRRRKGTQRMLEALSTNVLGGPSRAVSRHQTVAHTTHLDTNGSYGDASPASITDSRGRRTGPVTFHVRDTAVSAPTGSLFDSWQRAVDLRLDGPVPGGNIPGRVVIYRWRGKAAPFVNRNPAAAERAPGALAGRCYHLQSVARNVPLYADPTQEGVPPGPLTNDGVQRLGAQRYIGPGKSIEITIGERTLGHDEVLVGDLSSWTAPVVSRQQTGRLGETSQQSPPRAVLDVQRSRLMVVPPEKTTVPHVRFFEGVNGHLGGGRYARDPSPAYAPSRLVHCGSGSPVKDIRSAMEKAHRYTEKHIRIRLHEELVELDESAPGDGGAEPWKIAVPRGKVISIEAAPGTWPRLRARQGITITGDREGRIELNGIALEGCVELQGHVAATFRHCTLVPGRWRTDDGAPAHPGKPSLVWNSTYRGERVTLSHCVVGAIRAPSTSARLMVHDSIIDAAVPDIESGEVGSAIAWQAAADEPFAPGPPTELRRCTVLGDLAVAEPWDLIDTLLLGRAQLGRDAPVLAGLVAASMSSLEPAGNPGRLVPLRSTAFGAPGYGQLSARTPRRFRSGGTDGEQLGAFHGTGRSERVRMLAERMEMYAPLTTDCRLIELD